MVDLSPTAAQAAQVAEAQVVDVHKLAKHVEVLDDLSCFHCLESPHVLCTLMCVLVPVQSCSIFYNTVF